MGYLPPAPGAIITLPKDVTITPIVFDAYRRTFEQSFFGQPVGIVRPWTPTTYEQYRTALYGPKPRDWMPVLSSAFVVAVGALLATLAYCVGPT